MFATTIDNGNAVHFDICALSPSDGCFPNTRIVEAGWFKKEVNLLLEDRYLKLHRQALKTVIDKS